MSMSKMIPGFLAFKKRSWLLALGALAAAVSANSSSEASPLTFSVPGHAGHAWQPGSATCFSTPSFSNAVENDCNSGQSYLVPIVLQADLNPAAQRISNVSYFASSVSNPNVGGGGTVPICRAVVKAFDDSQVLVSGATNLTGSPTEQFVGSLSSINPAFSTQHLDCFFPAGVSRRLTA